MLRRLTNAGILLTLLGSSLSGIAEVPDWLRILARETPRKYADDVNAVKLLQEDETTVRDKGEIVEHGRRAYRILRPEGRDIASFEIEFGNDTKVNFLRGWSITAKGQEYEAKEAFERSVSTYEVYSDLKAKIISVPGADVGTVIGIEFERKHRPNIFEDEWDFQSSMPVERARYTLRLPSSWEMNTHWVNHAEQQPIRQGDSYVWEITNISKIESEYRQPPRRALAGHMVVSFSSEKFRSQTYKDWNQLAAWHAQMHAGSFEASPSMQQKVQELAPASLPLFDRIKALARFAQKDIRYAAIEIGIGGFRPHPASEVFTHRYGDCKDKAALLKSMLSQIGVKSYLMPIQTDRGVYTDKSPANLGFNHVIIAIQLPEASYKNNLPALYEHPKLGHLLIFDPTSELVPFGQIPSYAQDNYALLVAENGGELIHLPLSPAEFNSVNRTASLTLLADGTLKGDVEESLTGYFAAAARNLKDISLQDRKKVIEHMLGRWVANFQVDSFDIVNAEDIEKDLVLHYKFSVGHYAKNAGPLLLVRPRVIGEMAGYYDASKPRHYAYEFEAPFTRSDKVEITLPDGFQVDELPEPARVSYPFGEYVSKTEKTGNSLKYTRQYKMQTTVVPLDKMDDLKKLFSQINADEKNMAVLKKAN
ncbi:MAG TPA: DUF3857 domain-containing protein [Candidatus Angelobacter sp.]|jgi:hypothetical protein|nr:DUF3857 domain-containing protein [Candidatus Angelobacter sp.]